MGGKDSDKRLTKLEKTTNELEARLAKLEKLAKKMKSARAGVPPEAPPDAHSEMVAASEAPLVGRADISREAETPSDF